MESVGEIIPLHYEIRIGKETIAFIYQPIACHSYNVLFVKGQKVKIATIDTMLSFYLAFLYVERPYYNEFSERILCMSKFLFEVQQKNRLEQKGLLKRFSIICYGHQESVEEMRAEKAAKYRELKQSKNKAALDEWFLNYKPDQNKNSLEQEKSEEKDKPKKAEKKKKTKAKAKARKPFFDFYGKKTRKNKKGLY